VANSDLPEATCLLREWLTAPEVFEGDVVIAQSVARNRIGEGGDFNLSGDRYAAIAEGGSVYPLVPLGNEDLFKIESGGTPSSTEETYWNGGIPWATLADLPAAEHITKLSETVRTISDEGLSNSSAKLLPIGSVLVSSRATIGRVALTTIPLATNQGFKNIIIQDKQRALPGFVAYMMKRLTPEMERIASGGTFKEISKTALATLSITLPNLEIQYQLVTEIEGYQKVIDGARQVIENYKSQIVAPADCLIVTVGDIATIRSGGTPDRNNAAYWGGTIPWIKTGQIDFNVIDAAEEFITEAGLENSAARMFPAGTILMAMYGQGVTRGRVAILGIDATTNQACAAIEVTSQEVDRDFLYWSLVGKYEELRAISDARGGNQSNLNAQLIRDVKITLPTLEAQLNIVAEIKAEQALVDANHELIRRMESKIKTAIDRVWGDGVKV